MTSIREAYVAGGAIGVWTIIGSMEVGS